MSQHPIVHIEIAAKNREVAGKFYSDVFGWKVQQLPEMNYATFEAEGGPGGGLNPVENNQPTPVMVYIDTDNIDATLHKIQQSGGKLVRPTDDVPGMGQFAFFSDPSGNILALWHTVTPPSGD
jgi:predicted enzyme related to lactoylglutathione lyase